MNLLIRPERPSEAADIEALTVAAFARAPHSSHTEQHIINALRRAGQLSLSLVALADDRLIGHVAASPVVVSSGAARWYGLGPLSVTPERQGQGVGSRLVRQALARLREAGAAGCVVLGEPEYYARFGFKADSALVLPGLPPKYFQAVVLAGPVAAGIVAYHAAFAS